MPERTNDDNLYKVGTIITARANPDLKLIIKGYKQHIYYCVAKDDFKSNDFAYFENELISSATQVA
jgi:hypothetical protein